MSVDLLNTRGRAIVPKGCGVKGSDPPGVLCGGMTAVEALMDKMTGSIQGGRSFGPAFEHDGCTVIPVAYVFGGGGGGSGTSPEQQPAPPRTGTGGGFGFVSWPIGAYVIKNGEVTWRPLFDVGGLALLAVGVVRLLIQMRQRNRDGRR